MKIFVVTLFSSLEHTIFTYFTVLIKNIIAVKICNHYFIIENVNFSKEI